MNMNETGQIAKLQRMPYYHPTLEEGLFSAAEDLASKLKIKPSL